MHRTRKSTLLRLSVSTAKRFQLVHLAAWGRFIPATYVQLCNVCRVPLLTFSRWSPGITSHLRRTVGPPLYMFVFTRPLWSADIYMHFAYEGKTNKLFFVFSPFASLISRKLFSQRVTTIHFGLYYRFMHILWFTPCFWYLLLEYLSYPTVIKEQKKNKNKKNSPLANWQNPSSARKLPRPLLFTRSRL